MPTRTALALLPADSPLRALPIPWVAAGQDDGDFGNWARRVLELVLRGLFEYGVIGYDFWVFCDVVSPEPRGFRFVHLTAPNGIVPAMHQILGQSPWVQGCKHGLLVGFGIRQTSTLHVIHDSLQALEAVIGPSVHCACFANIAKEEGVAILGA